MQSPEAVRALMNACFEALVPVIGRFQGFVDKFLGDAILALFGAPVAHENHPEQALRAALAMREALDEFNRARGTDLGLHFGISTGLVVAGGIGSSERQEYSVMGDAVNVAARLEDASERGEILVGPDTQRLSAPLFEFEALPPLALKGKAEPVQVYRLRGLKSQAGPTRGIAGLRSPLVGRDDESERLRAALAALRAGQGATIAVTGEAGLGKSRLVAEARQEALAGEIAWAEGRALSYTESMSYFVARDVLRGLLGVDPEAPPAAVTEAVRSEVRRHCGTEAAPEIAPYLARLLDALLTRRCRSGSAICPLKRSRGAWRRRFLDFVRAGPRRSRWCWSGRTCTGPTRPRSPCWRRFFP
jgi:class 3 adenylate cyclase